MPTARTRRDPEADPKTVPLPDDGPNYDGPPPVAPDGPEGPHIGAHQLRVLMALLRKHGIHTDAQQYDYLTLRLGHEVTSRRTLTPTEAARLIADLDAEPVPAGTGIYAALAAVMADVGAVAKDSRNTQQNFNFRGIDAVVNAVSPALRKHQVVVLPDVQSVDYVLMPLSSGKSATVCRVVVAYRFVAVDGSHVQTVVAAEAFDMGDKATPKAMSVAFRTALLQALALPTDDPDPDSQVYESASYDMQRAHRQQPPPPAPEEPSGMWRGQPDPYLDMGTSDLLMELDNLARYAGVTYEAISARWREEQGGITLSDMEGLPDTTVRPYVATVRAYLDQQGKLPS